MENISGEAFCTMSTDVVSNKAEIDVEAEKIFDMLDLFYANKHMYDRLRKKNIGKVTEVK